MNGCEKSNDGLKNSEHGTNGVEGDSSLTNTSSSRRPIRELSKKLTHISEILETVLVDIYGRTGRPKYSTGLRKLDYLLWGLHKKELLILGARTSQGKSALALQLAITLARQGLRIGYFSLEMSKEQLVERIISNVARIDSRHLRHGIATTKVKNEEDALRAVLPTMKLLINDECGFQFDDIIEICETLKFDFVFLDYIQMISTKAYRSKIEAIDEYVRKFKELCKVLDMGGVMVSQVNRGGADDMSIANLKGSGTLEEHPDTVILLEWDKDDNEYWIRVEKQRHGECGKIGVAWRPEYFLFEDDVPQVTKRRADINDV